MIVAIAKAQAPAAQRALRAAGFNLAPSNQPFLTGPDRNIEAIGLGLSPKKREQVFRVLSTVHGAHPTLIP